MSTVQILRELLREIADDCKQVARDATITYSEKRTWLAIARKAEKVQLEDQRMALKIMSLADEARIDDLQHQLEEARAALGDAMEQIGPRTTAFSKWSWWYDKHAKALAVAQGGNG